MIQSNHLVKRRIRYACLAGPAQRGVMLLEVLIAVLIFSVGILGVIGLQGNMIKATAEAQYRSEAAFIAQKRIDQLWTMTSSDRTASLGTSTVSTLPSGQMITTYQDATDATCAATVGCYSVTVTWVQPGTGVTRKVNLIGYVTTP